MKNVLLCLAMVSASVMAIGCAAEEDDYVLVIPDTSDGPDQVEIERPTSFKTTRAQALQYCNEVQYQHYSARAACTQTYHNDVWLQQAYQSCVDNLNNNVTDACVNQYASYVYWLTRRAQVLGGGYYGDQFRWYCTGGWPALSTPNDTTALYNAWLTCEPNI